MGGHTGADQQHIVKQKSAHIKQGYDYSSAKLVYLFLKKITLMLFHEIMHSLPRYVAG